jgi:hypothetical protein
MQNISLKEGDAKDKIGLGKRKNRAHVKYQRIETPTFYQDVRASSFRKCICPSFPGILSRPRVVSLGVRKFRGSYEQTQGIRGCV